MEDPERALRDRHAAEQLGRRHLDRRLRHRLFLARLPDASAGAGAEDRQVLRHAHGERRRRAPRSCTRRSSSRTTSASRSWPRASSRESIWNVLKELGCDVRPGLLLQPTGSGERAPGPGAPAQQRRAGRGRGEPAGERGLPRPQVTARQRWPLGAHHGYRGCGVVAWPERSRSVRSSSWRRPRHRPVGRRSPPTSSWSRSSRCGRITSAATGTRGTPRRPSTPSPPSRCASTLRTPSRAGRSARTRACSPACTRARTAPNARWIAWPTVRNTRRAPGPAGYQTAGVASGPYLRRAHNLRPGLRAVGRRDLVPEPRLRARRRDEPAVTEAALRYLAEERDPARPFFLFVYFWDPHYDFFRPRRTTPSSSGRARSGSTWEYFERTISRSAPTAGRALA